MANFALEKKLTKTLVLSRLTQETLENLLLNVLVECNYHSEVKVLQRVLPNASSSFWNDGRVDKIARSIVQQLDYDAEACARVVVNADPTDQLRIALKYIGMGSRLASTKVAGTGLKAVQAILPSATDRQAKHFLEALVSEIIGSLDVKNFRAIEGDIEVFDASTYYGGHNPSNIYPDDIQGVVGGIASQECSIKLSDLERSAKISLAGVRLRNRAVQAALCDALTKNIKHNVLAHMDDEELDEVCGEVLYEVENSLPSRYEVQDADVSDYDFKVMSLTIWGDEITVLVQSKLTYDVSVNLV